MVELTIATSEPVALSGGDVTGPVELVGSSFTLLGQSIESGAWCVVDGVTGPSLVQLSPVAWRVEIVLILALLLGVSTALRKLQL